jgi:predicted DNA-binding transcriptional regulator AlpA
MGPRDYEQWFSTNELADFLGIDPSSLRRWRTARPPQGPPWVKVSDRVTVYRRADVDAWLRSRRTDPEAA